MNGASSVGESGLAKRLCPAERGPSFTAIQIEAQALLGDCTVTARGVVDPSRRPHVDCYNMLAPDVTRSDNSGTGF